MFPSVSFRSCQMVLLLLLTSQTVIAADWSQYRGLNGDGTSAESIGTLPWPTNGPRQVWKIQTPLGFSSFCVAGDRAFTVVNRDGNETCLALNADTGQELWSHEMSVADYNSDGGNAGAPGNRGGDGPRTTPASNGKLVFIYDGHLVLTCLDAKSGQVIWQHDVMREFAGRNIKWFNAASPVIDDQHVYVAGGGAGQTFLAFDQETGKLAWKRGDETITHATARLTKVDGKKQLISFMKSGLVSVDATDGRELWRCKFPFSTSTAASPIVDGDLVYCSAGYGVGAGLFKIKPVGKAFEAEEVWFKNNQLMNHWSTPVLKDGHLYGIFGFKKYGKAPLQCVELASGEIKWSERGFGPGNLIMVGESLVVLTDDGRLVIADAKPDAYQKRAEAKVVDGKCWSTPAYSNGRVYVRSTKEGACLDLTMLQ